jgi:L-ascorbate 6-phosphate lactonase
MVFAARLKASQAAIFFLGQAGYVIRSGGVSIAIDPYLSDSVGKVAPDFARALPVPVRPEKLDVDVFIVTHDHLDHLDPETVSAYRHARTTAFVAPRLAAAKLAALGIPRGRIRRVDSGESARVRGVMIAGVYAVPTGASVIDTTGYRIEFPNGRSVYHTSDTVYSKVLIDAAPRAEVLLVCINGKWGNLNVRQAVRLAGAVRPRYAIPNHYDMMRLNAADPKEFKALMAAKHPSVRVRILRVMKPFVW